MAGDPSKMAVAKLRNFARHHGLESFPHAHFRVIMFHDREPVGEKKQRPISFSYRSDYRVVHGFFRMRRYDGSELEAYCPYYYSLKGFFLDLKTEMLDIVTHDPDAEYYYDDKRTEIIRELGKIEEKEPWLRNLKEIGVSLSSGQHSLVPISSSEKLRPRPLPPA